MKWWDVFHLDTQDLRRVRGIVESMRDGHTPDTFEMPYTHRDGTRRVVEVMARPEFDEQGVPTGVLGIIKDITERHNTERVLRQAATVFANTDEGIIVADADRKIIAVNEAFTRITGYTEHEVLGQNPRLNASGRHDRRFYRSIWLALETEGQWRGEIWNRRKNGEIYPAWENISAIRDEQGQIVQYVALFSDITPIKQAEERFAYLAHHDALTGLPNRLRFMANLEQAMAAAARHGQRLALLFLDLDGFKPVNDTMGHSRGDELLRIVAHRIRDSVRGEDTAARIGGDEFTLILSEINLPEDAALVARQVIDIVQQPVRLGDDDVSVSVSVGISVYPDCADSVDGLMSLADEAMYAAKRAGPGNFRYSQPKKTSVA